MSELLVFIIGTHKWWNKTVFSNGLDVTHWKLWLVISIPSIILFDFVNHSLHLMKQRWSSSVLPYDSWLCIDITYRSNPLWSDALNEYWKCFALKVQGKVYSLQYTTITWRKWYFNVVNAEKGGISTNKCHSTSITDVFVCKWLDSGDKGLQEGKHCKPRQILRSNFFNESFSIRPLCSDETNILLIRLKQIMEFWLQLHVCNSIVELRAKYNYIWWLSWVRSLCAESVITGSVSWRMVHNEPPRRRKRYSEQYICSLLQIHFQWFHSWNQ